MEKKWDLESHTFFISFVHIRKLWIVQQLTAFEANKPHQLPRPQDNTIYTIHILYQSSCQKEGKKENLTQSISACIVLQHNTTRKSFHHLYFTYKTHSYQSLQTFRYCTPFIHCNKYVWLYFSNVAFPRSSSHLIIN